MKINDIFKNEKNEILKGIENLPVFNCIDNFVQYIDQSTTDKFEQLYIRALREEIEDLGREVIKRELSSLKEDELMEKLVSAYIDPPYSFQSYYDNDELVDFFENNKLNDADAHPLIKEYMLRQYNILVQQLDMKSEEKSIISIQEKIAEKERILRNYEEDIVKLKRSLNEIKNK